MKPDDRPKSAYEIAMEKLRRQDRERGEAGPVALSDDQKEEIAEIRRRYDARLAEREILHQADRRKHAGNPEELEKIEKEYLKERTRIDEQRQRDIAAVHARTGAPSGPGGSTEKGSTSPPAGSPPARPRGRRPRGSPSG